MILMEIKRTLVVTLSRAHSYAKIVLKRDPNLDVDVDFWICVWHMNEITYEHIFDMNPTDSIICKLLQPYP